MSTNTAIEWCDSTFNPWIGCTKISPACDHCYAEAQMDKRLGKARWGAGNPRVRTSAANWKLPRRWNAHRFAQCSCGWRGVPIEGGNPFIYGCRPFLKCEACGNDSTLKPARRRVFCASLADVFDNEVDPQWRRSLLKLIAETPNLDWLLLTKRIGNALPMLNAIADEPRPGSHAGDLIAHHWRNGSPPANVCLGATICNQAEADRDILKLLRMPAAVRFLSIEPMLGAVDLTRINLGEGAFEALAPEWAGVKRVRFTLNALTGAPKTGIPPLNWIIAGGESGPHARPSHPDWFRSLRDQCAEADVPFLFKQWGEWMPISRTDGVHELPFGEYLPNADPPFGFVRAGKANAGRSLDGVEHNAFPVNPHIADR